MGRRPKALCCGHDVAASRLSVITHCNGRELLAEADFPSAIEPSGGLLQLTVLENANAQPAVVTIAMQRLVSTRY